MPRPGRRTDKHTVKPRWVWGGLALAVGGGCLVVGGMSTLSRSWIGSGSALLLLGAVLALRGGILHDAHRTSAQAREELAQVVHGGEHFGIAAGQVVDDPAAQRDARRTAHMARAVEGRRHATAAPGWSPVTGWVLLLVTAGLVAPQWELVARDATGRTNSYRDTGLAILIGLAGLSFASAPGRHRTAGGVAVLAGLGLVLNGSLANHHEAVLAGYEVTCGAFAIGLVVLAWLGPPSVERPPQAEGSRMPIDAVRAVPSEVHTSPNGGRGPVRELRHMGTAKIVITLFVVVVVALRGLVRGLRRHGELGEVRYGVPLGQDPAPLLAALRLEGLAAWPEIVRGDPVLAIGLDAPGDRERAREALREAEEVPAGAAASDEFRFDDEA